MQSRSNIWFPRALRMDRKRRQHIVFQIDTHLAFAAVCISGFLALPLPVACRLSLARSIAGQGRPASSQARTATPRLGKRALMLANRPEQDLFDADTDRAQVRRS